MCCCWSGKGFLNSPGGCHGSPEGLGSQLPLLQLSPMLEKHCKKFLKIMSGFWPIIRNGFFFFTYNIFQASGTAEVWVAGSPDLLESHSSNLQVCLKMLPCWHHNLEIMLLISGPSHIKGTHPLVSLVGHHPPV